MKTLKFFWQVLGFILIAYLLSIPAVTYAVVLRETVTRIQKKGIETLDLTASFVQESYSQYLDEPEISKGMFYFKKPKKMRWDYYSPEKQEVVTDGETLWIYVEEDRQVNVHKADSFFGSKLSMSFLSFLSGEENLEESFNVTSIEEGSEGPYFILKLVPKDPYVDLKELFLWFSKENFNVARVRFSDFYGNLTIINLDNVKANTNIPDSRFTFSIPQGVEVINDPLY